MEIVEKIKKRIKLNERSLKTIDFGTETTGAIEDEINFLNELLIICDSSQLLLCVDDTLAPELTVGVKYATITEDQDHYLLVDDNAKIQYFAKMRFKILPAQ